MSESFVHESELAPILTENFLKLFACEMGGQCKASGPEEDFDTVCLLCIQQP